jgi:hypothetical protein
MIRLLTPFHFAINVRWWTLSLCLLCWVEAFAQNTAVETLTQARAAIAKQEWIKAESLLQPLLQGQRQDPFAFYEVAQVYENTNRVEAAKKIYRELTTNPDLLQRQPTLVIRAPYASRMVSLLALAQSKLNAIDAKQLAALPQLPKPSTANPAELIAPKSVAAVSAPSASIISATLQSWVDAWVAKDLHAYYASYLDTFKGELATQEAWRIQRSVAILPAKTTAIDLKNVELIALSASRVQVRFLQISTVRNRQSRVNKTLIFISRNGRWLIESETVK